MNLEQTARAYFSMFQNKDLDSLSEIFDDDEGIPAMVVSP